MRFSRQRIVAATIAASFLAVSVGVWISPPIRRWAKGPTATEVALASEQARANDLKNRLDEATRRLRQPRPVPVDTEQLARAEDLKAQIAELEEIIARPDLDAGERARAEDLLGQLKDAERKLREPSAPLSDLGQKARADDLAAQNEAMERELSRPRPVIEPPVVAALTRGQIAAGRNLFGIYTTQAPFSMAEVDLVQGLVERKANVVGYFQSFEDPFRADAIKEPWKRGQVPLLTWEPQAQVGVVTAEQPQYKLSNIIGGNFDGFIRSYARGIRDLGLPVIMRFAHEMNGRWYPWSEVSGFEDRSVNGNARGEYVAMWRHVHAIFEAEGANQYTIWLWSPNRVNKIPSQPVPAEYYPGDDVVDWIGMSGYLRPNDEETDFNGTFGSTLDLLRQATGSKPIFLSEIGATEIGGDKPAWIRSLFSGLQANPDINGFAWFSLPVTSTVDGERNTNDWRINSSPSSTNAMREELAGSGWGLALGG